MSRFYFGSAEGIAAAAASEHVSSDDSFAEYAELVRHAQFSQEKAAHLNSLLHDVRGNPAKEHGLRDPFGLAVSFSEGHVSRSHRVHVFAPCT